ncbi:MAG: DUF3769 domain-containing protein [Rhizonema sp. NSF051]|nr:DUF3769 domain-containing protein [Rhizonema sp. NSF051]
MLHPVLPPATSSSVEHSQPAAYPLSMGRLSCVSCLETDIKTQQKQNEEQKETPRTSRDPQKKNQLTVAETLPIPSQPETLPPEFSPMTPAKSAASLGDGLGIGYPIEQVEGDSNPDVSQQVTSTLTKSKSLSHSKAQLLVEKLAQQREQSDTNTVQSPSVGQTEPFKVEFNSQSKTNQPPTPSTIVFKSRSQTAQLPFPTRNNQEQQNLPLKTTPTVQTTKVIEVIADRQEYDSQRRVVTAVGNVVVRYDRSVLNADRLQVSLDNLFAVGDGNIVLRRGDQTLRGQRFTYNFIQDSGNLRGGRGEINVPSAQRDFSFDTNPSPNLTTGGVSLAPLSDRIAADQPLQASGRAGVNVNVGRRGNPTQPGGIIKRLRFEAANVDFYPQGWQARDVRITNDPFSPPELELRADKITLTRESPLVDRLKTVRQRLVFDQNFSVPIPRDEQVIDRRQRDVSPTLFSVGYDSGQRGGIFIERTFQPINTESVRLSLTPQFFVQKAFSNPNGITDLFGLKTRLNAVLSPQTVIQGYAVLPTLDSGRLPDLLRASLRLRQGLSAVNPYIVTLESSYRDRLYNGSLGYQTVQSSIGGVITSPIIPLGTTGLTLRYQGGAQYINANTDRQDLLSANRQNDRISLSRIQASATIDGGVFLWRGKPLPATPTQGLRYTATPIVPFLRGVASLSGVTSYYGSGDNQSTLSATIGLEGQIGHDSRDFLDYSAFNIRYSQGFNGGLSPFLFDRSVDNRVLTAGLVQQIYGPFRLGFQATINLDTGRSISTDYIVEYSRRTYGITLRYNPDLQLGGISFQINDFNWSGGTNPFTDNSEVKPVVNGVVQDY